MSHVDQCPEVTYHVLYNAAAAEAKLRMAGVRDLSAAASWARVGVAQGTLNMRS